MPRKPRVEVPHGFHHVVAKGNAGQDIVTDDTDRRRLLERMGRAVEKHRWSCLAYCLLDNHLHVVVQTPEPNLGIGMKWLKASYAQDFNHRHERHGHLFGGRFYSKLVQWDEHLISSIVYVALNPVRAGIARSPESWPWSSYAPTIGSAPAPAFLDTTHVLALFDSDRAVARLRLREAVEEGWARDRDRGQTRGV